MGINIDTSIEKAMNVVLMYGTLFNFNKCGSGFYYYDMSSADL